MEPLGLRTKAARVAISPAPAFSPAARMAVVTADQIKALWLGRPVVVAAAVGLAAAAVRRATAPLWAAVEAVEALTW